MNNKYVKLTFKVILPLLISMIWIFICVSMSLTKSGVNYFILWILIGLPFGIKHKRVWVILRNFDLGATFGMFVLNIISAGLLGGFYAVKFFAGLIIKGKKIILDEDVANTTEQ